MVSLIISAASAFSVLLLVFSRLADPRSYWRTAAALMGGLCAAGLRFGLDMIAYQFDWWTFGDTAYAPVITYVPVVFWFGAGLGLVGWRMIRNWARPAKSPSSSASSCWVCCATWCWPSARAP